MKMPMAGCNLSRQRYGIPSRKLGMPDELNREPRSNRGRARHCYPIPSRWTRGNPVGLECATVLLQQGGKAVSGGGKPGDLPEYFRGCWHSSFLGPLRSFSALTALRLVKIGRLFFLATSCLARKIPRNRPRLRINVNSP